MRNQSILNGILLAFVILFLPTCGGGGGSGSSQPAPNNGGGEEPRVFGVIIGKGDDGVIHNQPSNWPPAAGEWNGKAARLHHGKRKLAFETFREDIRGGSLAHPGGTGQATGVTHYFVAGPGTGTINEDGTTVVYVSDADGKEPRCIGCADVTDGVNGVEIYKVLPSASSSPNSVARQAGRTVYANQNKDLPAWHPSGEWIIMGVEFPVHAMNHSNGNSELGMYNDLWAVSLDGRIWVQLTDYVSTWEFSDPVAKTPYACLDIGYCATGCQYATLGSAHPYISYSCSSAGSPPPASGTMRPTIGHLLNGAFRVPIVWAERTGLNPNYAWGGVLQLALAEIDLSTGRPALVNYRRNLTPTPSDAAGVNLWSNPGGNTVIGAGYEPFSFSRDDSRIGLASDVFLSTSNPAVTRTVSSVSQFFTDSTSWKWESPQSYTNITAYDAFYAYENNGAAAPVKYYGHWEEPTVFSMKANKAEFTAFGSSANLNPPMNPTSRTTLASTFGLEVWAIPTDRSRAATRLTSFNTVSSRFLAYPTAVDPGDNSIYATRVPYSATTTNPPGVVILLEEPEL